MGQAALSLEDALRAAAGGVGSEDARAYSALGQGCGGGKASLADGGGVVGLSGQIEMVREEEVPSILQGVSLTLISPQRITISSHLIHQGLKWVDKVSYARGKKSQLVIFSTGKSLDGQEESDGEIIIDASSPQEIKIQAALTASGEGLTIKGKEKSVHILGSLQIADYFSNENALSLIYDEGIFEDDSLVQHAPRTAKPVLWLSFLKPVVWKEN